MHMIVTAAKKLYAQVRLSQAVVAVMKEAEKTSEETYRNIERMYAAGTTVELNVLGAFLLWVWAAERLRREGRLERL
jgi:outer membrane protein TolC